MSTDAQGFPLRDVFVATANLPPVHIQIPKLEKSHVTARIPSSDKQLSHPALRMKPKAQLEDIFTPPHPTTEKLNTAAICCQVMLSALTALHMGQKKKQQKKTQKRRMIALTTSVSISRR